MTTPICYAYDPNSGVYLGAVEADPSPLEPGVWLYPADTTLMPPPTAPAQEAPVFSVGAWSLLPDYRGQTWYDKSGAAVIVKSVGDPTTMDLAAIKPAPPPAPANPYVTGRQIKDQVTAGGYSAGVVGFLAKVGQTGGPKPDDYLYWLGIALDTPIPITTPKVGRILVGGGVINADGSSAVPAFMAAAAKLPA